MALLRFFFGHGWWVLWYLAFHLIMLVGVVMTLVIFAQELKPPGEKPALASLGSMLVFMIGLSLAGVTLVNAGIWSGMTTSWPWYAKGLFAIAIAGVVAAVSLPLNNWLAINQSYPSFWANVAVAAIVAVGNLVLLWTAIN